MLSGNHRPTGRTISADPLSGWEWRGLIICILIYGLMQLQVLEYIVDDAYIHLTFARNLLTGSGFSFNPGHPTYGITAPLFTLLLAGVGAVVGVSAWTAKGLAILFAALSIPAFHRLAKKLGLVSESAMFATLFWSVNVWLVRWSASGMEASLAVLLVILAVNAQASRSVYAGLWFGLAVLVRPELAILLGVLVADYFVLVNWRRALSALGLALLMILPWLVYAFLTFGTIIPNPALVKSNAGLPIWSDFSLGLLRTIKIIGASHGLEVVMILIGLTLVVRRRIKLSNVKFWIGGLLLIWAVFPAITYLARGVYISSRYLILGIPPLILGFFLAFEYCVSQQHFKQWSQFRKLLIVLLLIIQLGLTFRVTIPHVRTFMPTINALEHLAETLRLKTPEDAVVAVGDVGVLGFAAERFILDLEGLVFHEIIPLRRGRHLDDLILTENYWSIKRPDYLIDKAQNRSRLHDRYGDRYEILQVEPMPGGQVDNADEQWYYTLYQIHPDVETKK